MKRAKKSLANFPNWTSVLSAARRSLGGTEDLRSIPADVEAGWERFAAPRYLGLVEGMNHYDWTDGATARELEGDGVPTRPQAQTRQDALRVLDTFADAVLGADEAAWSALESGTFPGVEWR